MLYWGEKSGACALSMRMLSTAWPRPDGDSDRNHSLYAFRHRTAQKKPIFRELERTDCADAEKGQRRGREEYNRVGEAPNMQS